MISMDQYEYIRTAHRVYGKGVREIARETGHDDFDTLIWPTFILRNGPP